MRVPPRGTAAARQKAVAKNLSGRQLGVVCRCTIRGMNVVHTGKVRRLFKVLQTSKKSQTAMMVLKPGEESGPMGNDHPTSEQVLYVVKGQVVAEIGTKRRTLKAGDCVVVPLRARHRFVNESKRPVVTFNVYAPPAYDEDEES
jgi:mannose-6-phosphate isomerase-like protein (cupin superfamily)